MTGKPGGASTLPRPSSLPRNPAATAISSSTTTRSSEVPSHGSSATDHGTVTCPGAAAASGARR